MMRLIIISARLSARSASACLACSAAFSAAFCAASMRRFLALSARVFRSFNSITSFLGWRSRWTGPLWTRVVD